MKGTGVYIGEEIKKVLAERKMTKAALARRLGIKPQSVEYLLKRKSIDTDTLYNVSLALEHDFALLYSIRGPQGDFDNLPQGALQKAKAKLVVEFELEPEELARFDLRRRASSPGRQGEQP